MRELVKSKISTMFPVVLNSFETASKIVDKNLLKACDKHISLFLSICEWAEGDKPLYVYKIKNTLAIKQSMVQNNEENQTFQKNSKAFLPLNKTAISAIEKGAKIATKAYILATKNLEKFTTQTTTKKTEENNDFENKEFVQAVKSCLIALEHIVELCRISEYAIRAETYKDIIKTNSKTPLINENQTPKFTDENGNEFAKDDKDAVQKMHALITSMDKQTATNYANLSNDKLVWQMLSWVHRLTEEERKTYKFKTFFTPP